MMLRAGFIWFQLLAGLVIFGEDVVHMRITKKWGSRQISGLLLGALLTAIAVLEIFLLAYNVIPDAAVWPSLLSLDVLAILVYTQRTEPSPSAG